MISDKNAIIMPELYQGILIKRYKRFLADVELKNGKVITAHCANTGSMLECSEPGRNVWLSYHDNPGRKYKYSWDIIDMGSSLVGVNTGVPNRLVKRSVQSGLIEELKGYDSLKGEIKTAEGSRLDLGLFKAGRRDCYVEIKNCSLVRDGRAFFPDAVTKRGLKHLLELQRLIKEKNRALMFYLIQRSDAKSFSPADHIDPEYGKELRQVMKSGVEVLAYSAVVTTTYIQIGEKLPLYF